MSTFQLPPQGSASFNLNNLSNFQSTPLIPGNMSMRHPNVGIQSPLRPGNVGIGTQSPLKPGGLSIQQPTTSIQVPFQTPFSTLQTNEEDLPQHQPSQKELMKSYQRDQKRKEKQHGYYLRRKEKLEDAEKLSQMVAHLQVEILSLRQQLAEKDNIITQYQRSSLNK